MGEPIIVRRSSPVTSDSIEVDTIPREFFMRGQQSIMNIIRSGDTEGLTVAQIAEMTNISERAVRQHLIKHAITAVAILPQSLRTLKDAGVLLAHARSAMFVSKEGVQKLLRHIGTPESLAIYYQLWDNSEKLARIEARLLEAIGNLKAAMDRNTILQARIRMQDQEMALLEGQLAEVTGKLEAADHHIALGGNRKAPKFNIPVYRREANDIFNNPVYTIEIVKKCRADMSPEESHRFSSYHATRTMSGLSYAAEKSLRSLGVSSESIYEKLATVQNAVTALREEIEPNALGLALHNGNCGQEYLN